MSGVRLAQAALPNKIMCELKAGRRVGFSCWCEQPDSSGTRRPVRAKCRQAELKFQDLGSRQVVANFSVGHLRNDGGALLIRQVNQSIGLSRRLASCFRDERDPRFAEHAVEELVRQRLLALALGYGISKTTSTCAAIRAGGGGGQD